MSDTTPGRRKLKFNNADEVMADINHLQQAGYTRVGKWSLPQICWHVGNTITSNLIPPASEESTPEEAERKKGFFGTVLGPAGIPEGRPLAAERQPAADLGDEEIPRFAAAWASLKAYPHRCAKVGGCGPVPIAEVVQLHLVHAAHHLSFLVPASAPATEPS